MGMGRKGPRGRKARTHSSRIGRWREIEQLLIERASDQRRQGASRATVVQTLDRARKAAKNAEVYDHTWEVDNDKWLARHFG